jgi:peptidoglycan/LPS O-acetylase OafA/YrhL
MRELSHQRTLFLPLYSYKASDDERPDRFRALDGLRGLAALHVVFFHLLFPNHFTHNSFVKHGYIAVDLFFMLSGFVIAANYSHRITSAASFKRFIGLRFFRLYPLHVAILLFLVVLEFVKFIALHFSVITPGFLPPFTGSYSFDGLVANLVFLQGLPVVSSISWNAPSWSISCEFVTYLVFGVLVITGTTQRRGFFVVGAALAIFGYSAIARERGTLDVTTDLGIIRCLAGFFFGMLLFHLREQSWGTRLSGGSTGLITLCEVVVVTSLALVLSFASGVAEFLVVPILVATVGVFQLDRGYIAAILMTNPLQFLGRISYSIYMVHAPVVLLVGVVLRRVLQIPTHIDPATQVLTFQVSSWFGDVLVIAIVAAIVVVSTLTFALIEAPARDYGRRLLGKRRETSAPSAMTEASAPPS